MPPINFFGSFGNTDFLSRHGIISAFVSQLGGRHKVPGQCIRLALIPYWTKFTKSGGHRVDTA